MGQLCKSHPPPAQGLESVLSPMVAECDGHVVRALSMQIALPTYSPPNWSQPRRQLKLNAAPLQENVLRSQGDLSTSIDRLATGKWTPKIIATYEGDF